MKKYINIFLLGFICQIWSQTATTKFDEANELYRKNNFQKAIEAYHFLIEQGYHTTELHYNLGNAYYKINKIAHSIYHYEKALQIDINNKDAFINLQFAKKMCIDVIEVLPENFSQKIQRKYIGLLTYDDWAWVGVVFSFVFAIFFLLFYFGKSSQGRRLFFVIMSFSMILMVVSLSFSIQQYNYYKKYKPAIVFSEKINVQDAPNDYSKTLFQLHEGTKVYVLDAVANWKKIKLTDGKIGWIEKQTIKELK